MNDALWPYQWRAVLSNGMQVEVANGRQADARSFASRVTAIHVYQLGRKLVPFGIPIPPDAQVVIFRRNRISTDGSHSTTYFFGWESPDRMSLWEFGGESVKHHTKR